MQLSHRDVYLGFFKDKKDIIIRLKSGMHLAVRGCRLYIKAGDKLQPVLQFSKKCNEDIKKLIESGYQPYDAVIRFICAWKDREDTEGTEETAIILADVYFRRDT